MSYATPEADFTFVTNDAAKDPIGSTRPVVAQQQQDIQGQERPLFAAPETAFGFIHSRELVAPAEDHEQDTSLNDKIIQQLPFLAAPETAFGAIHYGEWLDQPTGAAGGDAIPSRYDVVMQQLSLLAAPETAYGAIHYGELLDETLKTQLYEQQERQDSLPHTLSEALADSRPIVVTTPSSPFKVLEVNDAWVGLCGYSREEARNKGLGELLQGAETDTRIANEMVSRLQRDHYSEAYLTNYTKNGRKFQNHIQVGILSADDGTAQYFVGVLNEIQSQNSKNTFA